MNWEQKHGCLILRKITNGKIMTKKKKRQENQGSGEEHDCKSGKIEKEQRQMHAYIRRVKNTCTMCIAKEKRVTVTVTGE